MAHKAARRDLVEGFQPRHTARVCREALAAWATAVGEEARMRSAVLRLQNGTAIRCLQHWQAAAQHRRRLRRIAGQAACRLSQLSAARALEGWRTWLEERRGKAARLGAAVGLWRTCQLRSSFAVWQGHAQQRRQQAELLRRAVQTMVGLKMRAAWNAWAALVDERRAAADRLRAAVSAWQLSLLRKAFQVCVMEGAEAGALAGGAISLSWLTLAASPLASLPCRPGASGTPSRASTAAAWAWPCLAGSAAP